MDNKIGAVGFVPRYAGPIYPVGLVRVDEDSGEPIRGPDGLCIRCEPGKEKQIQNKNRIITKNYFRRVWCICG